MIKNEDIKFGLFFIGFICAVLGLMFLFFGIIPILLIGLLYIIGDIFNFEIEFIHHYIVLMMYGGFIILKLPNKYDQKEDSHN